MDPEDILRKIGLNTYEIKAYLALVSAGRMNAAELSSVSGIPIARVYDVMSSLERKGFAKIGLGRPTIYEANPPDEALSNYRRKMELDFGRRLRELEEMREQLVETLRVEDRGEKRDSFSMKEGDDLTVCLEGMIMKARERIYIVESEFLSSSTLGDLLRDAERRGVKIKVVHGPVGLCLTENEALIVDDKRGIWTDSRALNLLLTWYAEKSIS